MLAWTSRQKIPIAIITGIGSILETLGASEALIGDGFVVCWKDLMINVRRAYAEDGICCIVREQGYMWVYIRSG